MRINCGTNDGSNSYGQVAGKSGRHHRRLYGHRVGCGKTLRQEGAYVFITGRRQKELDEAVKAIGSNVTGIQGDVAKLADLDRLYEARQGKGANRYRFRQRRGR